MKDFKDDGEKWVNYTKWKANQGKTSSKQEFIHNNYSQEQINSLISNLDEVAV